MQDKEYIEDLEGLVCFLARCYEQAKNTYFDSHLETCSINNPNRRDLTESEEMEYQKFPLIQGTILQNIIRDISQSDKANPKDIKALIKRFLSKTAN